MQVAIILKEIRDWIVGYFLMNQRMNPIENHKRIKDLKIIVSKQFVIF